MGQIKSGFDVNPLVIILRSFSSGKMSSSAIGLSCEMTRGPVTNEEARLFAHATRDPNESVPGYIPPFFFASCFFDPMKTLLLKKELRMNILRMVHGDIDVAWLCPMKGSSALRTVAAITGITQTSAGELLHVSGELYEGKDLCVKATSGFLVRSKPKKGKDSRTEERQAEPAFSIAVRTEDGQELDYAEASGDRNLIHTNGIVARLAGFPRTILHGLCVMAMCRNALVNKLTDGDQSRIVSMKCRFAYPVFPGETLSLNAFAPAVSGEIPFECVDAKGRKKIKNASIFFS
jgi:hypothetical protein